MLQKHRLKRTKTRTKKRHAPRPKRTTGTGCLSVCQNAVNKWIPCVSKAFRDERESEAEQESTSSESQIEVSRTQTEDEDSPDLLLTASTLNIGSQSQDYIEVLDKESLEVKHEVIREIKQKYGVVKNLAEGGNGIVFSANRVQDNFPVIVKVIPRNIVPFLRVRTKRRVVKIPREVYMLVRVGAGPDSAGSIVTPRLLDWYDSGEAIILVIERPMPCVDLLEYVRSDSRDGLDLEESSKIIFRQLLDAAMEMEARGVFHRDIKPCNVLIETRDDELRARFIDFGHAKLSTPNRTFDIPQGTTAFSSPEWFRQEPYTARQATVWQMGCVLFILLFRKQPLVSEHSISSSRAVPIPNTVSPECKDFLRCCLNKDSEQRMSLEDLRNHPWML
ncbi:unnamed protein product [Knipowitschia caucasica]